MNETQKKFKCEYSNENYATDSAGGVVTWEAFGRVWVICVFRVPVPCKIWDHVKLCVVLELEWWSEAEREKRKERERDWLKEHCTSTL